MSKSRNKKKRKKNTVARADDQGRNHLPSNISTLQKQMVPQKVSSKLGLLWQLLGRFSWLVDKLWKILIVILGLLVLFFDLWAIFSVVPVVSAPASVDAGDLFRTPFSVSNHHHFFTMYNVHPVCGFDESLGVLRQAFDLEAEADVGDLPPNHSPATFVCRVGGRPATLGVRLLLTMHYDIRLLPGLYWPMTREFFYRVALDGEGKAYWQEGNWLYRPLNK